MVVTMAHFAEISFFTCFKIVQYLLSIGFQNQLILQISVVSIQSFKVGY